MCHPVVSANQVVAANRAIEQLVARGILTEPARRRNRVFHAAEVIGRLERG